MGSGQVHDSEEPDSIPLSSQSMLDYDSEESPIKPQANSLVELSTPASTPSKKRSAAMVGINAEEESSPVELPEIGTFEAKDNSILTKKKRKTL